MFAATVDIVQACQTKGRKDGGEGKGGGRGRRGGREKNSTAAASAFFFFFFLESVSHIGDEKTTNRGMGLRPGKTKVCDWKKMF